ncbi:hypothetical protein ABFS83_02G107500 [Erythranthe nasuta]
MSASTVSITGNQGPTTRRRAVEKNPQDGASDFAAAAVTESENKHGRLSATEAAAAILRDARKTPAPPTIQSKKSGSSRKSTKPRWLTVVSIITKNLALAVVLLGFVQMIRWMVMNSGPDVDNLSVISGDFDGKFSEVEKFVKTTVKAMQVQVNAMDQKLGDEISSVRKEFDEKIETKGKETDLKLKALDVRNDAFEKFMDGLSSKSLLSKEEFAEFYEEFKKAGKSDGGEVSLDEIRDFARQIVEKEIERHSADGLGMADYALVSSGARVVRHSEPHDGTSGSWLRNRNKISFAAEKMIMPSFGEPGQCFPLKGRSGFVVIKLRTAIVPEAVTLEHVAKSVAYDRSSAPKHCIVSGWMQGPDSVDLDIGMNKMKLLTEFTYDLDKTNAQTFKVDPSAQNLVDTIRFDVTSNHGSPSHICIYRLRVHGHEPKLEIQS